MNRLFQVVALLAAGSSAVFAQAGEAWFSAGESILENKNLGSLPSCNANGSNCVPSGSSDSVQLDNGFRFGFRFTFNTGDHMGHEIQYAYSRTHLIDNQGFILGSPGLSAGMAIHTGGYNFLYYLTKEGSRIRPFVTPGVHFSNFVPPGTSVGSGGGSTKFGFNGGVGVKVKVTDLFAVRVDLRQYETGKPGFNFCSAVSPAFGTCIATAGLQGRSGLLGQTEISAGFGVYF